MKLRHQILLLVSAAALCASCLSAGRDAAEQAPGAEASGSAPDRFVQLALPAAPMERKRASKAKVARADAPAAMAESEATVDDEVPGGKGEDSEPATRSWFPETFLFEPLVLTDASGEASVRVRVPDRLTTWRVLGLAHDRKGSQAGAEARFLGTLPAYVDPVLPAFLTVGDRLRLPLLAVNTTERPWTRKLTANLTGAAEGALVRDVTVPAASNHVELVEVVARKPGEAKLRATLQGADVVERTVAVRPRGRPVVLRASGTLAAPREVKLVGPANLDPHSAAVRLQVFPGALALLRSELQVSQRRSGVAHDAYSLLLAGRAPALMDALRGKVDPATLRYMRIVGTQRAVRHAPGAWRSPSSSPRPHSATPTAPCASASGSASQPRWPRRSDPTAPSAAARAGRCSGSS